jgi:hypothetical protein
MTVAAAVVVIASVVWAQRSRVAVPVVPEE